MGDTMLWNDMVMGRRQMPIDKGLLLWTIKLDQSQDCHLLEGSYHAQGEFRVNEKSSTKTV